MNPFLVAFNAYFQSVIVSSVYGYAKEVKDGGVQNRLWTFLVQRFLLIFAFLPLYDLFPDFSLSLDISYYALLIGSAGLNYLAYVLHHNEILTQENKHEQIQKLPFGLHKSKLFCQLIQFLAPNFSYLTYAMVALNMGLSLYFGSYLFFSIAILSFSIDQAYQRAWFPKFLEPTYRHLRRFIFVFGMFGLDNWFTITLGCLSLAFCIWDLIETHIRGKQSASVQFSLTKPEQAFSFENNLDTRKPKTIEEVKYLIEQLKGHRSIHITFNHMRDAAITTNVLSGGKILKDYSEFLSLFEKIDLNNPDIMANIEAELTSDDVYQLSTLEEHIRNLKLPEHSSSHEVVIAYLKREMRALVDRLNTLAQMSIKAEGRSINHEHRILLLSQATRVMAFLKHQASQNQQHIILISLSTRTGNRCSRAYIDTFSELSHLYQTGVESLTYQQRASLIAQNIRDIQFRKYYYEVFPLIAKSPTFFDYWRYKAADINDYHTYEDFASNFGAYFYLTNLTLMNRFRSPFDILGDWLIFWRLTQLKDLGLAKKTTFASHYTEDLFLKETLDGQLSSLFQEWCNHLHPELYNTLALDEDFMFDNNSPDLQALAKLFLLDMGIVELNTSISLMPKPKLSLPTFNRSREQIKEVSFDLFNLFRTGTKGERQDKLSPHPTSSSVSKVSSL